MPRLLPCLMALALLAPASALAQSTVYEIEPSAIDGTIHDFTSPNVVIPNTTVRRAPLVVFLTGAGEKPTNSRDFLKFVAGQGFQVIGLEYDDTPGADQLCAAKADPDCIEAFRRMRVDADTDGPGVSPVTNPPLESITARLIVLLRFLTEDKPSEGWDYYLDGDNIRWDRIVITGVDQGAGMAAYIAKHHPVARVVLFSSPWDTGPDRQAAPWLSLPSATPASRWFAEYPTGAPSQSAYTVLQVPADHIRITPVSGAANPFTAIHDRRYAPEWVTLFGKPGSDGTVQ